MASSRLDEFSDQHLIFFLESPADDDLANRITKWLAEEIGNHRWQWKAPEVFDSTEEPEDGEDSPVRTVGGIYWLKSPRDASGQALPADVDLAQLQDVEKIVELASVFSAQHEVEIGFELEGTSVGWIKKGVVGRLLQQGLLDPWRQNLVGG